MLVSDIIYGHIWTISVFYTRSITLSAMKSFALSALRSLFSFNIGIIISVAYLLIAVLTGDRLALDGNADLQELHWHLTPKFWEST